MKDGWKKCPGWFSFPGLYDEMVAAANDGDTIVEVGSAFGRSLAYLARRVIDSGKRIRVVGVDPGRYNGTWGLPQVDTADRSPFNTVLRGLLQHVPEELEVMDLLRCGSVEAARMFDDGSLAAVFVDGLHDEDGCRADLLAWQHKVKPGGIFAGHDIDLDGSVGHGGGVWQAVNSVLGPEGKGYRVWQDPHARSGPPPEWLEGENMIPRWGGPCWVRL